MAIGYLDAPPALEWREHHEQIGRPVAPVFVIMPGGLSWFRRDRHARFGNELLGRLVDADQGTFRIIRPLINVQDVLHGGHEGGAGVRGNNPLLSQMRLESVFFSVRPIVLSLARLTIFSSTTASSSSCNVQRARPAGGVEQANAINLASAAPSKMRRLAEFGECLRIRAASNPSSTSRWRVLATVSTLVSSAAAIWLSLQPSPPSAASAFNRAFSSFCAGWCPLWIRAVRYARSSLLSVTTYFFTAISFLAINPLRQQRRNHRVRQTPRNQWRGRLGMDCSPGSGHRCRPARDASGRLGALGSRL